MTTIRPNTKPPLWWLFPWSYARVLHMSANALKAYAAAEAAYYVAQATYLAAKEGKTK